MIKLKKGKDEMFFIGCHFWDILHLLNSLRNKLFMSNFEFVSLMCCFEDVVTDILLKLDLLF